MAAEPPAGERQIGTTIAGSPTGIPGTRNSLGMTRRPESAGFLLQGGARSGGKAPGAPKPIAQTRKAPSKSFVVKPPQKARPSRVPTGPPPLAEALERAGLGHYARKLCEDLSCSTVRQLLALNRPQLDALSSTRCGRCQGTARASTNSSPTSAWRR